MNYRVPGGTREQMVARYPRAGRAARSLASPLRDLHSGDAQEYLLFLVGTCVLMLLLPVLLGFGAFRWHQLLFDALTPSLGLLLFYGVLLLLTLAESTQQERALQQLVQAQRELAELLAKIKYSKK